MECMIRPRSSVYSILQFKKKKKGKRTLESASEPKSKLKKKLPWHVLTVWYRIEDLISHLKCTYIPVLMVVRQ